MGAPGYQVAAYDLTKFAGTLSRDGNRYSGVRDIVEAVLAAEAAAEAGKAEFLADLTVGGVDVGALLARGEQTLRDWTGER